MKLSEWFFSFYLLYIFGVCLSFSLIWRCSSLLIFLITLIASKLNTHTYNFYYIPGIFGDNTPYSSTYFPGCSLRFKISFAFNQNSLSVLNILCSISFHWRIVPLYYYQVSESFVLFIYNIICMLMWQVVKLSQIPSICLRLLTQNVEVVLRYFFLFKEKEKKYLFTMWLLLTGKISRRFLILQCQ